MSDPSSSSSVSVSDAVAALRRRARLDRVGDAHGVVRFRSPHHDRRVPIVYCDHTASSRPSREVERRVSRRVLPWYGNTHTTTSVTGAQSTALVGEARAIVAETTRARVTGKSKEHAVLFAGGGGATAAARLLVESVLGARRSYENDAERPVVFLGPFEHHSHSLPWRESGCEVVSIPECPVTGDVDLAALESALSRYRDRPLRVGAFSAASNVNGRLTDVERVSALLRGHDALSVFDHATAAAYVDPDASVADAVFFSPHKLTGGVNTPGVLVARRALLSATAPPWRPGGGTVFYVTHDHHRFLSDRVERNEGGTPDVVGVARVGLACLSARRFREDYRRATGGAETLLQRELRAHQRVLAELRETAPRLVPLLGPDDGTARFLPIFSFLIRCGDRFLHFNFVCALLNDLFGIQSRGGCQCAGPYSQRLLGLADGRGRSRPANAAVERALLHHKDESLRPGFTRLSLPFKGVDEVEERFVLDALAFVSRHGWAFLPRYRCDHRTGEWRHHLRTGRPLGDERAWLSRETEEKEPEEEETEDTLAEELARVTDDARLELARARADRPNISQALSMSDPDDADGLRWYAHPKEAARWLEEGRDEPPLLAPLKGALRPHGCDGADDEKEEEFEVAHATTTTALTNAVDDKESHEDVFRDDRPPMLETGDHDNDQNNENNERKDDDDETVLFRDGEFHSGNAPLREVRAGHEDGELSDRCEIFCDDDWINVRVFLERRRRKQPSSETTTTSVDATEETPTTIDADATEKSPTNIDADATEKSPTTIDADATEETPTTIDADATNESPTNIDADATEETPTTIDADEKTTTKKKHSRDSSHWGKRTVEVPSLRAVPDKDANEDLRPYHQRTKKKKKWANKPPPKLMRLINKAVVQFDMIQEGDKLLLGLSGGKDSLTLLHCLLELQRKLPVNFTVEVCTVDPRTPSFDPSPLIPYVRETLGLTYHYVREDIVAWAARSGRDGGAVSSLCAYCARMKRGLLYATARKHGCHKLVLAQHLDDCAESLYMSLTHNGFLRTMKARYAINAGDLEVIRPLVYARESLTRAYAREAGLPVVNENCPACFEEPKERERVKRSLAREETLYPNLYDNLRRAMIPLLRDDATAILRCHTEEIVSRSRKTTRGRRGARDDGATTTADAAAPRPRASLADASEEELVAELARRRAARYRLSGAMRRTGNDDGVDPTGQVCSRSGGRNGTAVPCHELME